MAEGIEANDKIPAVKDPAVRKRVTPRVTRPRKKQKQNDIYDDPEAVLGDIGSPLFKDGVNIKAGYVIMRPIIYLPLDRTSYYIRRPWQY